MRLAVALLLSLAALAPALAAPPGGKVKVAVTDIKNVQGVAQGTATILSDIIVSEVARHGYAVISQSDIDAMLGFEKKKQMFGCAEETSCLAEIGGALGVEYLFTGQVGKIGSRFRISLMVVDARRAAVVARAAQFTDADEDALARTSEEIVVQLLKEVAAIRQAAVAQRPVEPAPAVAKTAQPVVIKAPPLPPPVVEPKKDPKDKKGGTATVAKVESKPEPKPDLTPRAPEPRGAGLTPEPGGRAGGAGRTAGWWWVGGGGAAIAVGGLLGLQAKSELEKLKDQWTLDPAKYQAEYDSRSKAAKSLALIADAFFVAGAASAGWGTWVLLRSEPASVTVVPVPLEGGAGLAAAGRF